MTVSAKERSGSGLDYLRGIISGDLPNVPIGETLGFRVPVPKPTRVGHYLPTGPAESTYKAQRTAEIDIWDFGFVDRSHEWTKGSAFLCASASLRWLFQ